MQGLCRQLQATASAPLPVRTTRAATAPPIKPILASPPLLCLAFLTALVAAPPPARPYLPRAQRRHDAPARRPLHSIPHMAGIARLSNGRAEPLPARARTSTSHTSSGALSLAA